MCSEKDSMWVLPFDPAHYLFYDLRGFPSWQYHTEDREPNATEHRLISSLLVNPFKRAGQWGWISPHRQFRKLIW